MNRDKDHYNPNIKHYGDLDRYGDIENNYRSESRSPYGTRAYGDYSGGTRYGEGGSTFGGGSSYGHSYYKGYSRQEITDRVSQSENRYGKRRGDYNSPGSRESSGSDRNNDYSDFMNFNYGAGPSRGQGGYYDRGSGYGTSNHSNYGYDRGIGGYGNTGYGSTGYNNRDEDRERNIYNRRPGSTSGYSDRGVPDYSMHNIGKDYGAGRSNTHSSGSYGRSSERYDEDLNRSRYDRYAAGSDRGGYINKDANC
ncbi:hypothetical protein ACFSRY_14890 [Pontibacter locisalis]|uniref:Uncharacterized protein n=1 Tax=Pontibacter locisalis TaxID=1719035 RepID=A0ABW5IQA3_9BACT